MKLIPENEVRPDAITGLKDAAKLINYASRLIAPMMFACDIGWTKEIDTACATFRRGRNGVQRPSLYFNPDFMMDKLQNAPMRAFVLAHEVLHVMFEHVGRAQDMHYHPLIWNYATDYYINAYLKGKSMDESGNIHTFDKYESFFQFPEWETEEGKKTQGLYDEKWVGMGADEIYRKLIEEIEAKGGKVCSTCQSISYPGDQDGQGQPQSGDDHDHDEEGETCQCPECGQKAQVVRIPGGDPSQSPLDDVNGEKGETPDNATKSAMRRKLAEVATGAKMGGGIGDHEMGMVRSIDDLLAPKLSWTDQIENFVSSRTKTRKTYARSSYKSTVDIIRPSFTGIKVNILAYLDTSGSMSESDLREGLSEAYGAIREFDDWELHIASGDTSGHLIASYNRNSGSNINAISLNLIGGGGTDMAPAVDMGIDMHERGENVSAVIIFTDGYIPEETIESRINASGGVFDVLVVVGTGGNRSLNVEGAKTIFMDDVGR